MSGQREKCGRIAVKKLLAPVITAAMIGLGITTPSNAISGGNTAANTNAEIGRIFCGNGQGFGPTGSATLINNLSAIALNANNTLVLTASHVVGGRANSNLALFAFHQFQATNVEGTPTVEALSVPCPGWVRSTAANGTNTNDIAVMFTLAPVATGGTTIPIATAAVPVGQNVVGVGFSNGTAALLNQAQQATFTVDANDPAASTHYYYNSAAAANNNTLTAPERAGADNNAIVQRGDSGGPSLFTTAQNTVVVSGVHSNVISAGATVLSMIDMQVDSYTGFLQGNGQGGMAIFSQLNPAAAGAVNWSGAANWRRGAAGAQTVPGANDVVILQTTAAATLAVNQNSGNLYGLLNGGNVTLNDNQGRTVAVTGPSGVVNGGTITVDASSQLNITTVAAGNGALSGLGGTLDNVGTINVTGMSTLTAAASVENGNNTVAGAALNVTNATATLGDLANWGTTTIGNAGAVTVNGAPFFTNTTATDITNYSVFNNGGTITVARGGSLTINAPAAPAAAGGRTPGVSPMLNVGGTLNVAGNALLRGGGGNTFFGNFTRGVLRLDPSVMTLQGVGLDNDQTSSIEGAGTIVFDGTTTPAGTDSGDFVNAATPATAPDYDTRQITFSFVGALANYEAVSASPFNGLSGGIYGASDPFSIGGLNLSSGTGLTLVDDFDNQGGPYPDSLVTASFSEDSSSLLDLDNIPFWVLGDDVPPLDADIAQGEIFEPGDYPIAAEYFPSLNATEIVPVPEPASALLIAALYPLSRRRSAHEGTRMRTKPKKNN